MVYVYQVPGLCLLVLYQHHVSQQMKRTVTCWCSGVSLLIMISTLCRQRSLMHASVTEDSVMKLVNQVDLALLFQLKRMILGLDFIRNVDDVLASSGRVQCVAGENYDLQRILLWEEWRLIVSCVKPVYICIIKRIYYISFIDIKWIYIRGDTFVSLL